MENSQKFEKLLASIEAYTNSDLIVAFSGGVDSSLVLKLACDAAARKDKKVYAVTVHTRLHPMNEIEITKKVAAEAGAIHSIVHVDELQNAGIMLNPENRCYLCKKYIFTQLVEYAAKMGIDTILEGTNDDDLHVYRPGIKALRELDVKSPLAESGMTKSDVRQMAADYGISVASRPSAPCMATRFPYNTQLTYDKMTNLEQGEEYIRSLGFYNVRIRIHDDIARIEVDVADLDRFLANRTNIVEKLRSLGFIYITLDMEGFRSGSMDYKVLQMQEVK